MTEGFQHGADIEDERRGEVGIRMEYGHNESDNGIKIRGRGN